jgi:lipopolysaccharide biosynthesis regulator YciM
MENTEECKKYAQKAVEMDDYCTIAHVFLHEIYLKEGDTTAAFRETKKISLYNPEMLGLRW